MMRRAVAAALTGVALLSGCTPTASGAGPLATDGHEGTTAANPQGPMAPSPSSTQAGGGPAVASEPSVPGDQASANATPAPEPSFRELAMVVTVSPDCVEHGGTAEIRVEAEEGVQVVWGAVYDGGEGGGDPPLGSGHGGNGSGIVGSDGAYMARWTVRPSAPAGPAYVIVQAGVGDQYGYREVPFDVRDLATGC